MESKANGNVTGVNFFVGDIDGKQFDSGKVYVTTDLKGVNAKGTCTQEYKCANSQVVKAVMNMGFPFNAELSMEAESNGKGVMTMVVTNIKPVQITRDTLPPNQSPRVAA